MSHTCKYLTGIDERDNDIEAVLFYCGNIELLLKKEPNYCPVCGEKLTEESYAHRKAD